MKKLLMNVRMFLLAGLFLLSMNAFSQDPNFYIFLCFGQSNMEGQGTIELQDLTVDSRFQVMQAVDCSNLGRIKGTWYNAIPPLTRCWNGLSPADYFGRTMVANLPDSIRVGIVNVSVGGCKIELYDKDDYQDYIATIDPVEEDWLINIINEYDGNPYQYLVDVAKMAKVDGVIKGILLHQGESNTGDAAWPEKVRGVYDSLMADLGLDPDSVPLLAGEVVHADQGGVCASMNPIIDLLPGTLANSYVISSSGVPDAADNLHFNSTGYRELGRRYAVKMLELLGYELTWGQGSTSVYAEAECATVGENWDITGDARASNDAYVVSGEGLSGTEEAPADGESSVYIDFAVDSTIMYDLYARVNFRTAAQNSFWMRMDEFNFAMVEGPATSGWQWVKLAGGELDEGEHTLTIAFCEEGAKLDKINLNNYLYGPSGDGGEATNICDPGVPDAINTAESDEGYTLSQNHPNPFSEKTSISFEIPHSANVSLKVYNMLGEEVAELGGKEFSAGKHTVEFTPGKLTGGQYYYSFTAGKFSATREMIILE